jgi:SAM-dependent methyltransferase
VREDRTRREKQSYDEGSVFVESARLHARFEHVFTGANSRAAEHHFADIVRQQAAKGRVLSYGSVRGDLLMPAVLDAKPQRLLVVDISMREIEAVRQEFGNRAEYSVMDGHALAVPEESFDLVVGRAIIHHLEYETAIREIHRVLAPGGLAAFIEPLRGNPLLALARVLTPRARTRDETPLSATQLRLADRVFGSSHHLFFNLFSVPAGMMSSLVFPNPDNALMRAADRIDRVLAHTPLKYWMRSAILAWRKASPMFEPRAPTLTP